MPNPGRHRSCIFRVCVRSTAAALSLVITLVLTVVLPRQSQAQTFTVLYSFTGSPDGASPYAGLILDAAGNVYGTTIVGGGDTGCVSGCGTVFGLMPQAGGRWVEQVLHSFGNTDGVGEPYAGLIFDAAGDLYGTGVFDGVFELGGGGWTEHTLYKFPGGVGDGYYPYGGVIFDAVGNLYGTTWLGGSGDNGYGTVFQLMPQADGSWKEQVLHSFNGVDGSEPYAGLILDAAGNLYGTTYQGGYYGQGTVFELTPQAGGGWTEQVLHSFQETDGNGPYAGLIFDAAGNLYGTTLNGGTCIGDCYGTVFELTPQAGGGWAEQLLHTFTYTDGAVPFAGLIFDAAGNLYGTTCNGGTYGYGTVFELTPTVGGNWAEKSLHSFDGTDGACPYAGLTLDSTGNLYGTTTAGGASGNGTVFEITANSCNLPTGETTYDTEWGNGGVFGGTVSWFFLKLTGTSDYSGRTVVEQDAGGGADYCYFDGSRYPPEQLGHGMWEIQSGNYFNLPDELGFGSDQVDYYRRERPKRHLPMPCQVRLFQQMTISCPGTGYQNFGHVNPLIITVGTDFVSNARDSVYTCQGSCTNP